MANGVHRWLVKISNGNPTEDRFFFFLSFLPLHEHSVVTRYWCLKEALIKAIGADLGFGLQRLEFHRSNWTNISVYIDGVESRDWRFSLFDLDEGHWASVASGRPKEAVDSYNRTLSRVDFEEEHHFDHYLLSDTCGFSLWSVEQLIPYIERSRGGKESCVSVHYV